MPDGSVIITDADMDSLTRLVHAFKHSLFRDQQQLEMLDQTLTAAEVRPPGRMPKDVIRMNSRVRVFDFDTRQRELYTLTFPEEANISKGMISVLAPLGIALLGRRKRDVIEVQVPGGVRQLRVESVRQQAGLSRARAFEHISTRRTSHLSGSDEEAWAV